MLKRAGRYEIVAELGRGGFGQVYRAFDPTLNSMVAIKTLAVDNDASVLARFRNEAAASRRLHHPNIVTIFDFGEQDGTPFIVMELLEGQDLQRAIDAGTPLPLWHKMQIMAQIASGLGHAHAHDIVHRDVKPANVMLLPDGNVKIMDFGIALVSRDTQNRLTPRGAVIGTFRYMAPEQFRGMEQDVRGDIFAYGLMFYELLSGIHPFHAVEPAALMYNILNLEPPPICEACPGCPEQLQPVISRLLQKDPEFRYQSLEDVLFDCEPILSTLKRARAQGLFEEARLAFGNRQLEAGQALLRQVMELDPSYPGARELRERVQTGLRRLTLRPRIEALTKEGQEQLAAGNPTEAVQRFEAAARLDPTDLTLKASLAQAKEVLEQARRAARLIADAERALNAGDLSGAHRIAQQAAELAPADARARGLLNQTQAALAKQERQFRLAADLARARRLVGIRSWDEASAVLALLERELPQTPEIQALQKELSDGRLADDRRQKLASGLAAARQEIQARSLGAARDRLAALQSEFPDAAEVDQLLRFAISEIEALKRSEFVDRNLSAARALADRNRFADAIRLLKSALVSYPSDPILERELRSMASAQQQAERTAAMRQALEEAKAFQAQGRLEEALEPLAAFSARYSGEPAVEELRQAIERDREAAQRSAELRAMVRRVNELLARENAEEATLLLKKPPQAIQDHPEITELRTRAQGQLDRQMARAAALEEALAAARVFLVKNEFDPAAQVLATFTALFGADSRVTELETSIQSSRQKWQRQAEEQQRLAEERRRAEEHQRLLEERRRAEELQRKAEQQRHQAEQQRHQAEQQRRQAEEQRRQTEELNRLVRRAEGYLAEGKALEAARLLEFAPSHFEGHPDFVRLRNAAAVQLREQAEREAAVRNALSSAEFFEQDARFDDALAVLEAFVTRHGPDARIGEREQAVRNAREGARRATEIRELAQRARNFLNQDEPQAALALLHQAASLVSESQELVRQSQELRELQRAAESNLAAREAREAREAVGAILAEARSLQGRGELVAALQAVDAGLKRFPSEVELQLVRGEIAGAEAARQLEEIRERTIAEILSLTSQHRFDRARDVWDDAQSKLSGDEQLRRLQAEIEAQRQSWEAAQAEEKIQQSLNRARALLASQPAESVALLRDLSAEYPGRTELAAELNRAQEALHQAEENRLIHEVEQLCGRNRFEEALAKLDQVARQTPEVLALRQQVETRQAAAESELVAEAIRSARETAQQNPSRAMPPLEKLQREFPQRPEIAQAISEIRAAIRESERLSAIAEIQELCSKGKFSKARSAHRNAVARFGSDAGLEELLARIEAGAAPQRAPAAKPAPTPSQPEPAQPAPSVIAPSVPETTQLRPEPSPSRPAWVWPIAGAAAVAILGTGLWMKFHHPTAPPPAVQIQLAVRTDPVGASVQIGDRSCVTPNCQFDLAPGNYTIQAQLQGYQSLQRTVTLDSSLGAHSEILTLQPVPAPLPSGVETGTLLIQIQERLKDVLVFVDGSGSGRTDSDGTLRLTLEAKTHLVHAAQAGYDVSPGGEQQVKIAKNDTKRLVFKLTPQMSRLELRGAPAGIDVRADDTLLGRTDGTLFSKAVPAGDRVLRFSGGAPDSPRKFEPGETVIVDWPKPATVAPPPPAPASTSISTSTSNPPPLVDPAERDWTTVSTSADPAVIEDYLRKYPNSRHKDEASSRISDLAWNAVDQKDEQAVARFKLQYPSSAHISQAQSLLDQFEKQRLAEQQKKLDLAKQDETKKQQDKQVETQRTQVLDAVNRLNAAFAQRNKRNVTDIWPKPPKGILDGLALSVVFNFEPTQPFVITGDQATVFCSQTAKSAQGNAKPAQVKLTLQMQGAGWIVQAVGPAQ